ncbi:MAG: dehydrogenase, partial [Thermoguttaceae bacterium]
LSGLISLFGCTERVMPRWKRQDQTVAAFEENGDEIVRVPLREPVHIRKAYDEKYKIARVNCP